ncbi:46415_t:CDS:2, partial [Gigaspora margarita]
MKVATTAIAIVTVISKRKTKVKINTNKKETKRIYELIKNKNLSGTALLKENQEQMIYVIRTLIERKEITLEIKYKEVMENKKEVELYTTEFEGYKTNTTKSKTDQNKAKHFNKLENIHEKLHMKIDNIPDNQLKNANYMLNHMVYTKGKNTERILSTYCQKKALKLLENGLYKKESETKSINQKITSLEKENIQLTKK